MESSFSFEDVTLGPGDLWCAFTTIFIDTLNDLIHWKKIIDGKGFNENKQLHLGTQAEVPLAGPPYSYQETDSA